MSSILSVSEDTSQGKLAREVPDINRQHKAAWHRAIVSSDLQLQHSDLEHPTFFQMGDLAILR